MGEWTFFGLFFFIIFIGVKPGATFAIGRSGCWEGKRRGSAAVQDAAAIFYPPPGFGLRLRSLIVTRKNSD